MAHRYTNTIVSRLLMDVTNHPLDWIKSAPKDKVFAWHCKNNEYQRIGKFQSLCMLSFWLPKMCVYKHRLVLFSVLFREASCYRIQCVRYHFPPKPCKSLYHVYNLRYPEAESRRLLSVRVYLDFRVRSKEPSNYQTHKKVKGGWIHTFNELHYLIHFGS